MPTTIKLKSHPAERQLDESLARIEALEARLALAEPIYRAHLLRQIGRKATREIRRRLEQPAERALALIKAREAGLLVARPNWEEMTDLRNYLREVETDLDNALDSEAADPVGDPQPNPESSTSVNRVETQTLAWFGQTHSQPGPSDAHYQAAFDPLAFDQVAAHLPAVAHAGVLPMSGWSTHGPALGSAGEADRLAAPSLKGFLGGEPMMDRRERRELERAAEKQQRKAHKHR